MSKVWVSIYYSLNELTIPFNFFLFIHKHYGFNDVLLQMSRTFFKNARKVYVSVVKLFDWHTPYMSQDVWVYFTECIMLMLYYHECISKALYNVQCTTLWKLFKWHTSLLSCKTGRIILYIRLNIPLKLAQLYFKSCCWTWSNKYFN